MTRPRHCSRCQAPVTVRVDGATDGPITCTCGAALGAYVRGVPVLRVVLGRDGAPDVVLAEEEPWPSP